MTFSAELGAAFAAQWWGIDYFNKFNQLTGDQQSYLIAVYESQMAIEAVVADSQNSKSINT